ncbi:hypothetical protein D3C75_338420 [compost metagenome]
MNFEFDSEIKMLEGKMKWKVIYFPYSVQECFSTSGKVPVHITVDGHKFEHTLLPSKNGHYLVYNEFIRREVRKEIGDQLHVILTKCEEKREVTVPDNISKVLEDHQALELFLGQPDYIKREQLNHIELAKKDETKNNRILALMKKLKEN